jgi:predicted nicotinamide N-methyase
MSPSPSDAPPADAARSAAAAFIRQHLVLCPAPALPGIVLHAAHPASGLSRLAGASPYWAYHWAGGTVLARHVLAHPHIVAGRHVLDLGTGTGVVAIAAARAGAASVTAADADLHAVAAAGLNAEANGVTLRCLHADLLDGPAPGEIDLVLAGDVFYAATLARRSLRFLDRCRIAGIDVLIGDPGRRHLPRHRLTEIARDRVPDFAEGELEAAVYVLKPRRS